MTKFESGNSAALRHGGYSTKITQRRVRRLERELRLMVPGYSPADGHVVRLLARIYARIEVCHKWLDKNPAFSESGELAPVFKALSTWENTASRLSDRLGLTPAGRADLALQIAKADAMHLGLSTRAPTPLPQLSITQAGRPGNPVYDDEFIDEVRNAEGSMRSVAKAYGVSQSYVANLRLSKVRSGK